MAGRPHGSKDSKPRRTEKRALETLSELSSVGYGPASVAQQNLEAVDTMLRSLSRKMEKLDFEFEEMVAEFEDDGVKNPFDKAQKWMWSFNKISESYLKYIQLRQKWVTDVAKYTDYSKGNEKIIENRDGTISRASDLLNSKPVQALTHEN